MNGAWKSVITMTKTPTQETADLIIANEWKAHKLKVGDVEIVYQITFSLHDTFHPTVKLFRADVAFRMKLPE